MKTFHPFIHEDISASPPHADGTAYRVGIGIEYWEDGPQEVAKIQMTYHGVVSGRRSPSFPSGTDDFERVIEALRRLELKSRNMPMTAERFRAFRPDSPIVETMRRKEDAAEMKRILSKPK